MTYSPKSYDVEWLDFYYADGICYKLNRYQLAREICSEFDFSDDDNWFTLIKDSKKIHSVQNYEPAEDIEIKVGRANNDDKRTVRPTKGRAKERRLKSNILDAIAKNKTKTETEEKDTEEKEETEPKKRHRIYQRGTEAFEKKKTNENKRKQPRTHSDETFMPLTWNEHNISPEEERRMLHYLCYELGVTPTCIPKSKYDDFPEPLQGRFLDYALEIRYIVPPPPKMYRGPVYDQALPLADEAGYVLPRRVLKPKLSWKQALQSTW